MNDPIALPSEARRLFSLWGKAGKKSESPDLFHPLLCHCLDTAAIAGLIWDEVFPFGYRAWLADRIGCDAAATRRLLVFLSAVHDIGKATPAFQCKIRA